MAATSLLLGPILFTDFELPSEISWGGTQSLAIHRLPGGAHVIDAMGRDDAPISWSGIFTGPDASARAHALDLMRASGSTWPLAWDDFSYAVIIASFHADYRRSNWIPYRISCAVLQDDASAVEQLLLSTAQEAAQDLATAAGLSTSKATSPVDVFASGPVDLAIASGLAATAAQQATASFYLARAATNLIME